LTIERLTVPIRDLPLNLHGTTLVQLSDFHFDGRSLSPSLLQEVIDQTNAIYPDLIVLTGDFITRHTRPIFKQVQTLASLKSRYGTYAVLGNHDSPNVSLRLTLTNILQQAYITVLWNQIAYPLGQGLPLVGLAEVRSGECQPERVLSQLLPTTPRIVLAHNPDTAALMRSLRVDLQLSGHTHGGQIILPGIGPLPGLTSQLLSLLPNRIKQLIPYLARASDRRLHHWEWAAGLHSIDGNQLYVNRGLGTYPPGRWRCPPELTVLTLAVPPSDADQSDFGVPEARHKVDRPL
jgi:hypothetical protein